MQGKKGWLVFLGFTVLVVTALASVGVRATPAKGFTGTTLALGRLGSFEVSNHAMASGSDGDDSVWESAQHVEGASDLYVQSNTWVPGGSTGWHTHPGHSLIIVTAGTVTAYDGNDPSCAPTVYPTGSAFVDPGGGHVHLLRNEGTVEARTTAVQLIPAGAVRRIDAPAPGTCPF